LSRSLIAQQETHVPLDLSAEALARRGIGDGETQEGHAAEVAAHGSLHRVFARRVAFGVTPGGCEGDGAGGHECFASQEAEDGASVIAAAAGGAAVLAQALPEGGLAACRYGVCPDADDTRTGAAVGAELTGLEEEVDATRWPRQAAGALVEDALAALALFQHVEQVVKVAQVVKASHWGRNPVSSPSNHECARRARDTLKP